MTILRKVLKRPFSMISTQICGRLFIGDGRRAHLLLGGVVDGCQGDEAADVLSIFLENDVIPGDGNHGNTRSKTRGSSAFTFLKYSCAVYLYGSLS